MKYLADGPTARMPDTAKILVRTGALGAPSLVTSNAGRAMRRPRPRKAYGRDAMRARITEAAIGATLVLVALAGCGQAVDTNVDATAAQAGRAAPTTAAAAASTTASGSAPTTAAGAAPTIAAAASRAGLLSGRVTLENGEVYEGRLRWGGDEEALWSNYFNGAKRGNDWAALVSSDRLAKERQTFDLFGIEIPLWESRIDLDRPFMARFGDIARIEPRGKVILITLKSGATFRLARYAADDLADGVRVWDARHGVVDIGEWEIHSIELGATPATLGATPARVDGPSPPSALYGTVHTRAGEFTGLVQWNRRECLVSDVLEGESADGAVSLRFEKIRSIARRSSNSSLVTLLDGREVVLADTREVGAGNSGMYVDDARYGRVLVSWDVFERVDFRAGGTGPAYDAFAPGGPLTGSVVTRSGRRLAGRLVYDLDESQTTETLDAPSLGVDYMLPFALIASVELPAIEAGGARHATVLLRNGEALQLELAGDLGGWNAGMLVFEGGAVPEYVPWNDVQRIEFDGQR
jgi:hypothetical protein